MPEDLNGQSELRACTNNEAISEVRSMCGLNFLGADSFTACRQKKDRRRERRIGKSRGEVAAAGYKSFDVHQSAVRRRRRRRRRRSTDIMCAVKEERSAY